MPGLLGGFDSPYSPRSLLGFIAAFLQSSLVLISKDCCEDAVLHLHDHPLQQLLSHVR